MTLEAVNPPVQRRFDSIDMARGLALIGMFVFHFAWDLSFMGLIEHDIGEDWRWRWLARIVAGSFLLLAGFSLVLATRKGIDWRSVWRRLGMVAGAALLVTIGTRYMVPDAYVTFGILHHIALASLLGLALVRLPALALALLAAVAFIIPKLFESKIIALSVLDAKPLTFLGLGSVPPDAVDFVPVFPWFGCVLGGMALGKLLVAKNAVPATQATNPVSRVLAFGGRHSLAVYLIHQPVFIGLLMAAAPFMTKAYTPDLSVFTRNCQSACLSTGLSAEKCTESCACTMDRIKTEDLWDKTSKGTLTPREETRIRDLARMCLKLD